MVVWGVKRSSELVVMLQMYPFYLLSSINSGPTLFFCVFICNDGKILVNKIYEGIIFALMARIPIFSKLCRLYYYNLHSSNNSNRKFDVHHREVYLPGRIDSGCEWNQGVEYSEYSDCIYCSGWTVGLQMPSVFLYVAFCDGAFRTGGPNPVQYNLVIFLLIHTWISSPVNGQV